MKYSMRNIGKAVSVFEVNFTDTDTGRKWEVLADNGV